MTISSVVTAQVPETISVQRMDSISLDYGFSSNEIFLEEVAPELFNSEAMVRDYCLFLMDVKTILLSDDEEGRQMVLLTWKKVKEANTSQELHAALDDYLR